MMIYPIFLLHSGVAVVVGPGVFQRRRAGVEESSVESAKTVDDKIHARGL